MKITKAHGKKQHKQMLLAVLLMCCVAFTTIYSGIAYAANGNNYDTTPPVYEGVTFVQQGQSVSVNDELEVDVQCYDAESSIKRISLAYGYVSADGMSLSIQNNDFYAEGDEGYGNTFSYDATKNTAKLKFKLGSSWPAGNMYLASVSIVDARGNVATKNWETTLYTCTVSDYTYKPGVTPDTPDHKSVYLDTTYAINQTSLVKEGDVAHITISLPKDADVPFDENTTTSTYVSGDYNSDDGMYYCSLYGILLELKYNPAKKCFEGDFSWNKALINGKYTLSMYNANIWTQDTTYYLYKQMSSQQPISFDVKNATNTAFSLKTEKIKNSDIKQNGYYSAGDVIKFSIPAEGRSKIYNQGSLYLKAVAEAALSDTCVSLNYNQDTDCYEGAYTITEDTYPCEWRVSYVNFWANADNGIGYGFNVNASYQAYRQNDNYYFSVMQKNTFSAPTGSVHLNIRYIDENNTWKEVTVSKDQLASRQMTYKELLEANKQLVDFDAIAKKNGYTLAGFRDTYNSMMNQNNADNLVSLDTPIVFDYSNGSYTANLTAKYEGVEFLGIGNQSYLTKVDNGVMTDKGYQTVSYYRMMTDYNQKMIAVPEDATVGQVLANVESPKAVDGINFTKWSINTEWGAYQDVQETTKVSELIRKFNYSAPDLNLIANYDKNVVTISYSAIGKDMASRMYYTTSVFVGEDATYENALEALKENTLYKSIAHDDKLTVGGFEIRDMNPTYDPETNTYYNKVIDPKTKITKNVTNVRVDTIYDKYKVICGVNDPSDYRYGRAQAFYVTKGEKFDLPTTITDYKDITWVSYSSNMGGYKNLNGEKSIDLTTDITVSGNGTYTGERYPDPVYSPTYSPIVDEENPTISMVIGKKTYDSLTSEKDIKFNTYITNKDKITLTADDNVGVMNISYCLSSSPVADKSFDSLSQMASTMMGKGHKIYDKPFTIDKDGKYVIYAVAMDASYNYTAISSNGIVVDNTAPKITGIENGKTYNGETSFAVVDDNLSKVYINGKEATAVNGTYTLTIKDKVEQTIKAVDKAGNETSISVYVNDKPHEHSYVSKIASDAYLAKPATCTEVAVYYYACSCGEKSDATYTYGESLGHDFSTEYTIDKEATFDEMGYASRHCSRCDATTAGYAIPKLVKIEKTNKIVTTAPQVTNTTNVTPVTTPTSVTQPQPAVEEKPVVKMAEEKIVETVAAIAQAKEGDKVKVEMNGATVVSKDILKEAKAKGVDVVLQMEGYSWTIDAKDIKGMNLEDINLEVNLHAEAIPSKQLSKLAGDNPVTQISLTHEGNFGFTATLSFNLGSEYKDKFGNLYWYDSTGKMIFIDSGLIDADGNVDLTFSHASDYAIVMKDTDDAETIATADIGGKESAVNNANDTGYVASNHTAVWVVVILVLAVAGVGAVAFTKKRRK